MASWYTEFDAFTVPECCWPDGSPVSNWTRALAARGVDRGFPRGENTTVQRSIEILIGRLVTDEEFRRSFQSNPRATLELASAWGLELSPGEIHALIATDHSLWERVAGEVDARLQKASLKSL